MGKNIVIVGAGIAGLNAAKAARDNDKNCNIILLGIENTNTYTRTRIPHYISGEATLNEIMPYNDQWYINNKITFFKNTKVIDIDAISKKVITDKDSYDYDFLVLASGSSPFKPSIKGIELDNVLTIRSINDADIVKELSKKRKICTVIGGGLLGLEIAWSVKQLGCDVNIIEHNPRLLPRQTDEECSALLLDSIEEKGIKVYLDAKTEEFIGKEKIQQVKLKDGRIIDTDFVILSTGVRPNVSAFLNVGLDIGRAIKVNEYMETNIDGIYAAGDVAEYNGKNYCIWPISVSQGKIAGSNAAGGRITYDDMKPHTQLKIKGISLFTIGDVFCESCNVFHFLDKKSKKYIKFLLKDNIITGAIIFGEPSLSMKVKKAVENRTVLSTPSSPVNVDELVKSL